MKLSEKITLKGSLHSHGCWTDYRNPEERKRFPFDLLEFTKLCLKSGRDFQAITDIMVDWNKNFRDREHRYEDLLKTANSQDRSYEMQQGPKESILWLNENGLTKKLIIPRTQEILTSTPFKHILAIGSDEDIQGARKAEDILKEISDKGGYAILDHPFMCNAWTEEEILKLYQENLIIAVEWNGGLTFPSLIPEFIRKKTPSKQANKRILKLQNQIYVIANDDAHSYRDIERGAYTEYNVVDSDIPLAEKIKESIQENDFLRIERYSSFFSPVKHFLWGRRSQKLFGKEGLPEA